jgi:hypothetical protein
VKPISQLASKILAAFRKHDQRALRKLNDEVLKVAASECTKVNFDIAVFSYVLSKIVSKPRYLSSDYAPMLSRIARAFQAIVDKLDYPAEDELVRLFSDLEQEITRLDAKDPRFFVDLITKGRLKMAATFYAQGMSLGIAADMTGLEKQEIMDYSGETMMFDRLKEEKSIQERMKAARKFFE